MSLVHLLPMLSGWRLRPQLLLEIVPLDVNHLLSELLQIFGQILHVLIHLLELESRLLLLQLDLPPHKGVTLVLLFISKGQHSPPLVLVCKKGRVDFGRTLLLSEGDVVSDSGVSDVGESQQFSERSLSRIWLLLQLPSSLDVV